MPPDFTFQKMNFLFLLPPILKAIYDVFFKEKRGIPVNHRQSISYTILFGFALVLIDFRTTPVAFLWQSILLAVSYFFLIFDYLRNILAGKHWLYIDDGSSSNLEDDAEDSWVDRNIYARTGPLGLLFIKCWVFLTAHGCYYFYSYI